MHEMNNIVKTGSHKTLLKIKTFLHFNCREETVTFYLPSMDLDEFKRKREFYDYDSYNDL